MRKTLSLIVVAAAAAVGALIPATAQAASAPTVLWASSVEGDFGRIQVGTLAEAGVASLHPEGVYFEEYVDEAEAGQWRATFTDPFGFFESSVSTSAFVS